MTRKALPPFSTFPSTAPGVASVLDSGIGSPALRAALLYAGVRAQRTDKMHGNGLVGPQNNQGFTAVEHENAHPVKPSCGVHK
jgi:hypothetical protein